MTQYSYYQSCWSVKSIQHKGSIFYLTIQDDKIEVNKFDLSNQQKSVVSSCQLQSKTCEVIGSKEQHTMDHADFYAFVTQEHSDSWSIEKSYVAIGYSKNNKYISLRRIDKLNEIVCIFRMKDDLQNLDCSLHLNDRQELYLCAANVNYELNQYYDEIIILKMQDEIENIGNMDDFNQIDPQTATTMLDMVGKTVCKRCTTIQISLENNEITISKQLQGPIKGLAKTISNTSLGKFEFGGQDQDQMLFVSNKITQQELIIPYNYGTNKISNNKINIWEYKKKEVKEVLNTQELMVEQIFAVENKLFKIELQGNALVIKTLFEINDDKKREISIAYRPDILNEKWDNFVILELNEQKCYMIIQIMSHIQLIQILKYKVTWEQLGEKDIFFEEEPQILGDAFIFGKELIEPAEFCAYKSSFNQTNKASGTFIKTEKNDIIKLEESQDYMISQNQIKSNFAYHGQGGKRDYLVVTNTIDKTALKYFNENLSQQQIVRYWFNQRTSLVINMNAKYKDHHCRKQLSEFEEQKFNLEDILQPRLSLNGYSYASLTPEHPAIFKSFIDNSQNKKVQDSIILNFLKENKTNLDQMLEIFKNCNELNQFRLIIRQKQKEILLETDFRSFIEHCIFESMEKYDKCSKVLAMGIQLLIDNKSPQNQLIIETCVSLIFTLPLIKIPEETLGLIKYQTEEEQDQSSFFEDFSHAEIPPYHEQSQVIYFKQIDQTFDPVKKKVVPQADQILDQIRQCHDRQKNAKTKLAKIKIVSKQLSNSISVLRNFEKEKIYATQKTKREKFRNEIVKKQIEKFGLNIDELDNVRAMVDFKYQTQSKWFFIYQFILYILLDVIPFTLMQYEPTDSPHILHLLNINLLGQLLYMFIEIINILEQGPRDYFTDLTNIFDYPQFIAFVTYYHFKLRHQKSVMAHRGDDNDTQQYYEVVLSFLLAFLFITKAAKIQNLLKFDKQFGILVELIIRSSVEIIPFLVIFIVWVVVFALIYQKLGAYSAQDNYPDINPFMAFFLISFNNSIGNIVTPSFKGLTFITNKKYLDNIIALVYLIWFVSIVLSLIVLLNFVLALVSQVYENVMSAKLENIYKQRQELNEESDRFFKFINYSMPKYIFKAYEKVPPKVKFVLNIPNKITAVIWFPLVLPFYLILQENVRAWFFVHLQYMNIFKFPVCLVILPFHYLESIFTGRIYGRIHYWMYDNIIERDMISNNWKMEEYVDLLILVNCSQTIIDEQEWLGVVQTLKKFITVQNDTTASKIHRMKEEIIEKVDNIEAQMIEKVDKIEANQEEMKQMIKQLLEK